MGPKAKEGDAGKGKDIFMAQCASCHMLVGASTGPALKGIVDSPIASQDGFAYSGSLKGKSKLKWDDKNLDKWLTKPSAFAPGNKMGFAGIEKKQDRVDLIAYLKANS
jgi:cytochrome c